MPEKACSKCGVTRPYEEFPPRKGTPTGLGYICRVCIADARPKNAESVRKRYAEDSEFRMRRRHYYKKWIADNPEYQKQAKRLTDLGKKGLTPKDYDDLLAQQDDGCWICGGRPSRTPYLHIDHNHETGAIRGLLCDSCNLGLGKFRDRPDLLARAIEYLDRDTGFRVRSRADYRPYEKSEDFRSGMPPAKKRGRAS